MNECIGLITGASSGIGAALADRLAGRCRGLVLHARSAGEELEEVARRVRAAGTTVVTQLGDLADEDVAKQLVALARGTFGRLDALVANAGFPILKSFDQGGLSDIDYAFRGNVYSFFTLVREARPLLEASERGRVVALGSFTSHVFRTDLPQFPLSAASKGALEVAVGSLAVLLAPARITVNCVVPGFIEKDAGTKDGLSDDELERSRARIPLGRIGLPREVAATIEFLLSQDAGYITGQSIHVNGGLI